MAISIINELSKSNELIRAIRAMAQVSLDQSFEAGEEKEPDWAVVIALLAKMAEQEMDDLHNRLTQALIPQGNAPHA